MSTHLSLTGLSPSLAGFPKTVLLNLLNQLCGPNPGMHASRFGLFRFRSPLLTESHVVFSSSGYLDVSVHRVPLLTLCIGVRILEVCSSGFPHSEISGSLDICSSPKLFAAYHVFHRLLVPRHPPYALSSITNLLSFTGMNDRYTDIALSALAKVNFILVCFLQTVIITLFITMITSDVLIKIFKNLIISISYMQFSRYTVLSVNRKPNLFSFDHW